MRALSDWLRDSLSLLPFAPGQTGPLAALAAEDEAAFFVHCDGRFDHIARLVALLCLLATLLWWPTDPISYGWNAETLWPVAQWRLTIVLCCGAYAAAPRSRFFLRHAFWFATCGLALSLAAMGHAAGIMGGLDRPWFHLSYSLMNISVIMPLRFRRRVLMGLLTALGWLAGLFVFHPENFYSRYLPITLIFLPCVLLVSVLFGHFMFLLNRDNFLQARALSRNAAELESKVADKTQELRHLLSYLERAREDERAHVARELHDELGQELTALRYALALTRERFRHDPHSIEKNLGELDLLLSRTVTTTRGLVTELRPRVLDDLGLVAAAEWLVRRAEERAGLRCQLLASGQDEGLDKDVAAVAFRILQESLTNVLRHADATSVQVTLTISGTELLLRVRDDGKGFSPTGPIAGMGLCGMRERALSLGAHLHIVSASGAGTEISCRLPCPPATPLLTGPSPVVITPAIC